MSRLFAALHSHESARHADALGIRRAILASAILAAVAMTVVMIATIPLP